MLFANFKRNFLVQNDALYMTTKPNIINFLVQANLKNDALACLIIKEKTIIFIGTEGDCQLEMNAEVCKKTYLDYSIERYVNKLEEIKKVIVKEIKDGMKVYLDRTTEPIWLLDLAANTSEVVQFDDIFAADKSIYDNSKLENIKRNLLLNEKVYSNLKNSYKPAMTEYEVKQLIEKTYFTETGAQVDYSGDIVSGYRTCGVSGDATQKELRSQDTLILDLLPRFNGVFCDTTRTFFIEKPTVRQAYVYEVLLEILENTKRFIKPGLIAEEVYVHMHKLLAKENFSANMPHHAGHGLGFSMFQQPYFIKNEPTVLEEGMVIALEPGIYLPKEFGIRIEDNYLIGKNGCTKLGDTTLAMDYFVLGAQ